MLAKELNTVRVSPDGKFRNNYKRPIVNWGNSEHPEWLNVWGRNEQLVINEPYLVARACNKLSSFQAFSLGEVAHPEWTTNKGVANDYLAGGETIVVRQTLTGHGGDGIIIVETGDTLPDAPLYTKYFKKKHEYRVHVFDGKIIDFQEKKREKGNEEINGQVRNHDNGWVFCREGIVLPDVVAIEAIKAVGALGLTFGAVDVGYNLHYNRPCVFEVNTAPGLTDTTAKVYAATIMKYIEENK